MMSWPTFLYPDPKKGPETWTMVKHPRDRGRSDIATRPWYLRPPVGHRSGKAWHSLESSDQVKAERNARLFLDAFSGDTARHQRAQAELAGPAKVTLGQLAEQWQAAGYADADERPRSEAAGDRIGDHLGRALEWWGTQGPERVGRETFREYARIRRAQAARRRGQSGDRAIDLELSALSSMCQWAVAAGKLERNPFADRPRFRRAEDVEHCNEFRPATDEELHALLAWLWREGQPLERVVAGAGLAWLSLIHI